MHQSFDPPPQPGHNRDIHSVSMNSLALMPAYGRTNLYKYSYMNRIVGEWNQIPSEIRRVCSASIFKSKVSKFLTERQNSM